MASYFGILKAADDLSIKHLHRLKNYISKLITEKTPIEREKVCKLNIDDYIDVHNTFITANECDQVENLLYSSNNFNVDNIGSESKRGRTQSVWLSRTNLPYCWETKTAGKVTKKVATPISNFPLINILLDRVNTELNSELNSCLVTFYPDGNSGIRLHDDFEVEMDESQPIAVVSIGETRTVEFLHDYQAATESPVKSLKPSNGSLYVMKQGLQKYYRHRVPSSNANAKPRFSLSFRKLINVDEMKDSSIINTREVPSNPHVAIPTAPPMSSSMSEDLADLTTRQPNHHVAPPTAPPISLSLSEDFVESRNPFSSNPSAPMKNITVLFGTSITKHLNCEKLSDNGTEFINVSVSGARLINSRNFTAIPDISDMLENFVASHAHELHRVTKVIFSFGTNDLKFYRDDEGRPGDLRRFKGPIEHLINSCRKHFGTSTEICFQSVLPMRLMYKYTVSNFVGFNKLLVSMCHQHRCSYLDFFGYFLDSRGYDYDRSCFRDTVHLNNFGHHILHGLLKKSISNVRNYQYH